MIKKLELSELPLAAEVIRKSFATVAKEFGLTEQNCSRHPSFYKTKKLKEHWNAGCQMFGLYDNEKMVGYFSLSKDNDGISEIHNLSVLPEHRHKGYGKEMLDFCKSRVKELGGTKIKIDIIEDNTKLKNWYLENGFVHTGTKKFDHLPFTVGLMEWSDESADTYRNTND